jgi:4-diphosphocytidyl-2-C-methyl-D-erythritol kinase
VLCTVSVQVKALLDREHLHHRGEIVENVKPPLPLETPLLLVKPPIGCSTPAIFRALDLNQRSNAEPLNLLQQLTADPSQLSQLCVNDLEQPAFDM